MRTDVKVGLFVGIVALLLAGWFFWPRTQNATATIAIGGRDAITADRPVVIRPGQNPSVRQAPAAPIVPPPPAMTDTATPVEPAAPVAADQPIPSAGGMEPAAPPRAGSITSAQTPGTAAESPSIEPSVPPVATAAPAAGVQSVGAATIGREPIVHPVRAGETLEKIADYYYSDSSLAGSLAQANQLNGTTRLRPGTRIRIPDKVDLSRMVPAATSGTLGSALGVHVDAGTQSQGTTPIPGATPAGALASGQQAGPLALGPTDYKVQKGDTLYSIAKKQLGNPNRWPELLEINADKLAGKPESLRPGQVLRLARQAPVTTSP